MFSQILETLVYALDNFYLSLILYHFQVSIHGFFKHLEPLIAVILDLPWEEVKICSIHFHGTMDIAQ